MVYDTWYGVSRGIWYMVHGIWYGMDSVSADAPAHRACGNIRHIRFLVVLGYWDPPTPLGTPPSP